MNSTCGTFLPTWSTFYLLLYARYLCQAMKKYPTSIGGTDKPCKYMYISNFSVITLKGTMDGHWTSFFSTSDTWQFYQQLKQNNIHQYCLVKTFLLLCRTAHYIKPCLIGYQNSMNLTNRVVDRPFHGTVICESCNNSKLTQSCPTV